MKNQAVTVTTTAAVALRLASKAMSTNRMEGNIRKGACNMGVYCLASKKLDKINYERRGYHTKVCSSSIYYYTINITDL